MALQIKKATRELIWDKIALISPSGGGKTYSSLRLATGMLEQLTKLGQQKNGRILMVNTEQKRGYYYANEFDYDIVDMEAPHNPERYVEVIGEAVEANYPILIIDSTSHEWEGKGGCLELHQLAGGTYQSWGKVTPRHDRFITAIADSPIHIIATMRGKDQYEMEKTDGKTSVKKLGVGAKQRDNFEYEFTVTFTIDQKSNMASVQKDNTHLFENEGDVKLSEFHGRQLIEWANSGEGYTPPVRSSKGIGEISPDKSKELQAKTIALLVELGGSKNESLMAKVKEIEKSGNPNKIKDLETLQKLFDMLSIMKEEKSSESVKEN